MANDQTIYDDERSNDEEMMEALAEYQYAKSQGFIDYVYQNRSIGNGDMLIEALEDTTLQEKYIKEAGLPLDVQLEY
jgi:predicted restriction endonuclease